MKVKAEEAGVCRKRLKIEVPAEEVSAELVRIRADFARQARIPGFRKGKAPAAVVGRHYAKEIREEARDRLVAASYGEAIRQENLHPIAILEVENDKVEEGRPLAYSVVVDVPPEFKLPKYQGLSLKIEKKDVTPEDVEKRFGELLNEQARYEPVEGRPVQKDDLVQIDYEGRLDGRRLEEISKDAAGLGQGKNYWCLANENAFFPELGQGLVGAVAGESRDIAVNFPKDFMVKEVAGRQGLFHVLVTGIRQRLPAVADKAFLDRFQAESVEALKTKIKEGLVAETEAADQRKLKDQIVETLLEKTALDLPETVVQEETRNAYVGLVRQNLMRGMTKEQVLGKRDEFLTLAGQSAAEKVKLMYILHRIADEEKIAVEEEELTRYLGYLAMRANQPPDRLRKDLEEKKELDAIRGELRMNKTLDRILAGAKINEEGFFGKLIKGVGGDKKSG
ncbi:MAG: trigger factor [Lentisphaerae bacterium]|nr:trigger factor [Lentisphaerota bacterium]